MARLQYEAHKRGWRRKRKAQGMVISQFSDLDAAISKPVIRVVFGFREFWRRGLRYPQTGLTSDRDSRVGSGDGLNVFPIAEAFPG